MALSKYSRAKFFLSLTLLFVHGNQVKAVSHVQGQDANLIFPYPCDSTRVTLQQSINAPFYRSTHGTSLSLPEDQAQRFNVQNIAENGNCFLKLTISYVLRDDRGTYILIVYRDGEILRDDTQKILLQVLWPPDKASCVVGKAKGGIWVSVDCAATVGSLPGKLECYQKDEWMPPLTDLIETDTSLNQSFLIRKSQPAFCCSSTLIEYKERCECKDTALFLDDISSKDPCPTIPVETSTTSMPANLDLINRSQCFNFTDDCISKTMTSSTCCKNALVVCPLSSAFLAFAITFALYYSTMQKRKNNNRQIHLEANFLDDND